MENICQRNIKWKKAHVAILLSDRIECEAKAS